MIEDRIDDSYQIGENGEGEEPIEKLIINKKRETFQVQIRNTKKKQILNNNRVKMYQKYMKEMTQDASEADLSIKALIPGHILQNPQKLQIYIAELIDGFKKDFENYNSSDIRMLYKSVNHLRQLSFLQHSSSIINQIIESDIHTILFSLIRPEFDDKLRLEAAWILTNCLAAECDSLDKITRYHYATMVESFASLYTLQDNEKLVEIGIWGLTNLCVDIKEAAEMFYNKYGVSNLEQKFITFENNVDIQENLAWMMTVFSQHQAIFTPQDRALFLKLAEKQIMQTTNMSIQHYGIRIIYQITNNDDCCLSISKKGAFLDYLFKLTLNPLYISYIIGIMGNIIACSYDVSEALMSHNILEYLSISLDNVRVDIRKEAMWCIANLLSGNETEIQNVIDYNRLIEKIFRIARIDSISVIYEVCMGLSNCLAHANNLQIMKLLQMGILEIFMQLLMIQDVNIVTKTLQGIGFLLDYGQNIKQSDQENPVKSNLQQLGFNQVIESLQHHPHDLVYDLAFEILTEYYTTKVQHTIIKNDFEDQEI